MRMGQDRETGIRYQQAFLGMVPFAKIYTLLDGAAQVTVRELRTKGIDLVYNQCTKQRRAGRNQQRG
jgi:hypothetical protein